ncbi:MAG: FAD:protein FMN transferase [Planctomycetota bacterium]|jgi:thiamine biosynthesis lipoprotein
MSQTQENFFVHNDWKSIEDVRRFSFEAMATTFEIFICHPDIDYARQAANAAFDELKGLEAQLSRFVENSDISRINNLTVGQVAHIAPEVFECLEISADISAETNGAFDVTVGSVAAKIGMDIIKLDREQYTVEVLADGLKIDLGGIGKGYAVDRMAGLLKQWSIDVALINAGRSTVLALNEPQETKGWPVTLSHPNDRKQILSRVNLKNQAISGSGLEYGPHIIDPRTAKPIVGKIAAWTCAAIAGKADAISTAFMVMLPDEIKDYCSSHPDVSALIVEAGRGKILRFGQWGTS